MQLVISNLSKTYANGTKALDDVTLTIPQGMYGLLGPNGAGKSSLMRTISTLQDADSGSIFLDDLDILNQKEETRKILGYLPQEFGVYPKVSATDLLEYLAVLKGIVNASERKEIVNALLEKVNLYDQRKKAVSGYSGGMRQRFGIAQCLLGNPKLVIVDEPTAGLDPGERNRFYNLLSEIGEKTIVILSTHIVQDVQELCNEMAIINKGKLLYAGGVNSALDLLKGKVYEKIIAKDTMQQHRTDYNVISDKLVSGKPLIHVYSNSPMINGFEPTSPGLEDVFFAKINELL